MAQDQIKPLSIGDAPPTLEHYIREFIRENLEIEIYEVYGRNVYGETQSFRAKLNLKEADGTYTTISESET